MKSVLAQAGLPIMASDTHIVPVFVGNPEKCKQASDLLLEVGMPPAAIRTERYGDAGE